MKHLILLILLFCFISSNAQKVKVALSGGINISDAKYKFYPLNEKVPDKLAMKIYSFIVGIKLKAEIEDRFDFKTGILMNEKGFKTIFFPLPISEEEYYIANSKFVAGKYTYLDVPLLLAYNVTNHIDFNFGLGINYHLNLDKVKSLHSFDVPAIVGFTYNFKRTSLDFQYSFGTIPFNSSNSTNYINDHVYTNYFHRQIAISINHYINQKIDGCLSCKSLNRKF